MLFQIFLFLVFVLRLYFCKYIGILEECEINIMKCFYSKRSIKIFFAFFAEERKMYSNTYDYLLV